MHTDQWIRGRKGVFGGPGYVFGEWFMGWLGEDTVREETRMIMESLEGYDKEVGLFLVHQEVAEGRLAA